MKDPTSNVYCLRPGEPIPTFLLPRNSSRTVPRGDYAPPTLGPAVTSASASASASTSRSATQRLQTVRATPASPKEESTQHTTTSHESEHRGGSLETIKYKGGHQQWRATLEEPSGQASAGPASGDVGGEDQCPTGKRGGADERKASGLSAVQGDVGQRSSVGGPALTEADCLRLQEALEFVKENDEHADILARREQDIDESLVNKIVERDVRMDEDTLLEETKASEAAHDSVHGRHLEELLTRVRNKIRVHKMPSCYKNGQLYDRPPHPIFTLHRQGTHGCSGGLNPSPLYLRKTFIWLPMYLPGHPEKFICTCGRLLSSNAYLSTRSTVSKLVMHQMTNTFASRFGPAPFAELFSEIQHRAHADGEMMYLSAAKFYGVAPAWSFSAFDDRDNYAGSTSSVAYLKALLPLTIAKADHTFDFLKHMGGVKGEWIFTAAYTILNEFEEVHAHSLTLTKSLSFVEEIYVSDPIGIENAMNEILQDLLVMSSASASMGVLALDLVASNRKQGLRIDTMHLRTHNRLLILKMSDYDHRAQFPPSLLAILTNSSLIKVGFGIRRSFQHLITVFGISKIETVLRTRSSSIFDLGKLAKLKGVVNDDKASLHALAGTVLRQSYMPSQNVSGLSEGIDCQWQIFIALHKRDAVGLPLMSSQSEMDRQLVTLVLACKPVAEGCIVGHHPGHLDVVMDAEGTTKRINMSSSQSLILLTKMLVPGAILNLHKQTLEWIVGHGSQAVVTTSQLRSQGSSDPVPACSIADLLGVPAPPNPITEYPDFEPYAPSPSNFDCAEEVWEWDSDDDDTEGEDDYAHFTFNTLDSVIQMEVDEKASADMLITNFNTGVHFVHCACTEPKFPTRVLDDALHFMDRLLRLLSRKNSAFKAFAHDFSEAIFIRDHADETAVRAVLEKHGIVWEYAKRAKLAVLNRRIRRIIPPRDILLSHLDKLFDAYADLICSTKSASGPFFTPDAREMWKNLRKTAQQGYLSDPPSIPLYYLMGKDHDGLNLYRTVQGTNSIEGGFHMAIHRVFGSLRASAELAECLLINWILRRNIKVGYHNRTGLKYHGHFALWDCDKIVEFAILTGVRPSFPLPRILPTRIATSETIGILPVSQSLATSLKIPTLPRPRVAGVPHHRDVPVHILTHLSTKPTNQYRYLQLRQLKLAAVLPVHTRKEFSMFKRHVDDRDFRKGSDRVYPSHERWRNVDFEEFTKFWNNQVTGQSRATTDSNQRLYYKIPSQLEAHHKHVIAWSSELATLAIEGNFAVRKEFLNALKNTKPMGAPAAITFPPNNNEDIWDGEVDLSIGGFYDKNSFNPSTGIPAPATYNAELDFDEVSSKPNGIPAPSSSLVIIEESSHHASSALSAPTPLPSSMAVPAMSTTMPIRQTVLLERFHPYNPELTVRNPKDDRCAVCMNDYCELRWSCPGKGNRSRCRCTHPPVQKGKRVRIHEDVIVELWQKGPAAIAAARAARHSKRQ
ncbi:unnamed protein product [Mycena citricolor]|uniref:3'-5' exonuclease domain-containing protein n=1 Tax=Mycena citricolor TaxID=2018698 RepID=A0AAD2HEZ4_9AGAR|nr:unnamed protein product [Mycena citricolor]